MVVQPKSVPVKFVNDSFGLDVVKHDYDKTVLSIPIFKEKFLITETLYVIKV
jgi:hypothetical protein